MKQHILSILFALLTLSPLGLSAQSVEIMGILPVGTSQEVVASINLNGKTVKSVTSYAYNMTTGYNLTGTTYALVENKYINVTLPTVANASAYRIAVTFTDGTTTLSPVFEPATGERFMWLGDITWTSQVCGWSGYSSQVDKALNAPTQSFTINDTLYYKGVAGHATGSITYTLTGAPYASFKSHIGLLSTEINGDVKVSIATNNTTVESFLVYAKANTGRGDNLLYKDVNVSMTGVTTLKFTFDMYNSNNWGDQVLMALARLYYPKQTAEEKQAQTVTLPMQDFDTYDRNFHLSATSSSGLPVYFRVAEGTSLATIVGDTLKFNAGAVGKVTVEACCYGDSIYAPANAFATITKKKLDQTITIATPGGLTDAQKLTLSATSNYNMPVSYRITEGASLATLADNVLTFHNSAQGTVVVEAYNAGDDDHNPGSATVSFLVSRGATILASRSLTTESGTSNYGYLYIDAQTTPYESLYMQYYTDVLLLTASTKVDLMPYVTDTTFTAAQVIEYPIPSSATTVYRVWGRLKGATADTGVSDYYENGVALVYMSDMTYAETHNYTLVSVVDICIDSKSTLQLINQKYAKGFGIHAIGTVTTTFGKHDFTRFVGDGGKQYGKSGNIEVILYLNGLKTQTSGNISNSSKTSWDYQLADTVTSLKIEVNYGGDGNGADWGSIGAPRFYRKVFAKAAQSLKWDAMHQLYRTSAFSEKLDATSSSGLPIDYKIVKGAQYANIADGVLNVTTLPDRDSIVVEAYQPGNHYYAPATPVRSVYYMLRGYVVKKGERLEINDNCTVEELVVYGDKTGAGEVIANGVVNVKRFLYKYTFVPGDWNFFSFPAELNLDQISNLNELGYAFSPAASSKPVYYVREYSTATRATSSAHTGWLYAQTPDVEGNKGYLIGISNKLGTTPREVTFTIDNAQLTFDGEIKVLDLTLDLSTAEPGAKIPVYISSSNTKSNTLKVEVEFEPADASVLPMNYRRSLDAVRVVAIPGGNGVRLTLPTQEQARVYILDKKMKRVLKAVRYVAPFVLDISDLKAGTYPMVVEYGDARRLMEITK